MFEPNFELLHYSQLDSTNEEAKRLVHAGKIQKTTLILANSQTAGKGTQGRAWASPPGAGLYLSVIHPFFPLDAISQTARLPGLPLYTLAAGVACAETIQDLTGLSIQLKPVNDLYVEDCKLGGILTESLISQNGQETRCRALITGIGINILTDKTVMQACEQDSRGNRPTSLQASLAPHRFNCWNPEAIRQELSVAIAAQLDKVYRELNLNGPISLMARYSNFMKPDAVLPAEIKTLMTAYRSGATISLSKF